MAKEKKKSVQAETPAPRKPVPVIPPADLSGYDTEADRTIDVALHIPFYGKKAQALKFVLETLPRIIAIGIGAHVRIGAVHIDGVKYATHAQAYSTEPGVNGEVAQGSA